MSMLLEATLFVLGLTGGFFSGLLGIGGGVIMVPLLLYVPPLLHLSPIDFKMAAGITMVQSLAGSFSALLVHRHNRLVHHQLVITLGSSTLIGALTGSLWSKYMASEIMLFVFAVLSLISVVFMFLSVSNDNNTTQLTDVHFNKKLAIIIGLVVGTFGGIIGQGGAFLLIPLMLYILHIPTRIALGSSTAIAFISAGAGFLGKWGTQQIPFYMAAILAMGAMIGALLGGYFSKRIPTATLRAVLALLIAGTALRMGLSLVAHLEVKIIMWFTASILVVFCLIFVIVRFGDKDSDDATETKDCATK